MGISVLLKNPESVHGEITAFAELTDHAEEGLALLSYANGFLTAVIVGPEFVPPSQWLPRMVDPLATSGDIEDVQIATNLILLEYHEILNSLAADEKAYEPFFWQDEDERIVTSDWAEGFVAGMHLRHHAWTLLLEGDYRIFTIILGVLLQSEEMAATLTEAEFDPEESLHKACEEAPLFIQEFYDCWAKRRPANSHPSMRERKAARNDPCPCGSGKKYKKCCLN
jgi:uncharacterized protein